MSGEGFSVPGGTATNVEGIFQIESNIQNEEVNADFDSGVTSLESLCMNCGENGTTRLLLTSIPYFQEVIIMSFDCEKCGFKNSEVQFGGDVQEKGVKRTLLVKDLEDLNRQIIKSDTTSIKFIEADFEIPAKTQRGSINTIEGLLMKAIAHLKENQEERRAIDPEITSKIDDVLCTLSMMSTGITLPFTIVVDDPAGNCFIENPSSPSPDPNMTIQHYFRSEAQNLACGLQPDQSHDIPSENPQELPPRNEGLGTLVEKNNSALQKVVYFETDCYACSAPGQSTIYVIDIPHFKEVIIMSFSCDQCGFKTNEVKGGGSIPMQGEKITLNVHENTREMLDRDILKSDTALVKIPEVELEMMPGSLGSIYTTVEGLLKKIKSNIAEGNPFAIGDSDGGRSKLNAWLDRVDQLITGAPFTLIIEDPLANSFIYSPYGDSKKDPLMSSEMYERSKEENEILGLNDLDTENYSTNESTDPIKSDKETMLGGGACLHPDSYHPNPAAVMKSNK